jgi:hypothetical protein
MELLSVAGAATGEIQALAAAHEKRPRFRAGVDFGRRVPGGRYSTSSQPVTMALMWEVTVWPVVVR